MPAAPAQPKREAKAPAPSRAPLVLAGAGIVLAALLVYANSFGVPFLLDDRESIIENASLRDWKDLGSLLAPHSLTTAGRPLVNLTLALNYAWTGHAVGSYHAVNLAIHVLAALTLFGVLRRTLRSASPAGPWRDAALPLGALLALVWTVHPVQTAAVTYISQRAESLMALFCLLTLYAFIRALSSDRPARWRGLSVLCCFAGMATKEVMVTTPLLVLLYDRVFCATSFREALARRPGYYAALASSWLLLAYFMVSSNFGDRSVGFSAGVSGFTYALTECKVVVLYLKLALWPSPLVFDYGREMLVREPLAVLPYALLILAGLAGTTGLFRRGQKAAGLLAAAWFILLAPTSSVVPIVEQPMAESRMYLPLAAVVTLAGLGIFRVLGRRAWHVLGALAVGLGALTVQRNRDYATAPAIWEDALRKHPENSRGQYNLGVELGFLPERRLEAVAHYREALRIRPDFPQAHNNLGMELAKDPARGPEAIAHYEAALRLQPDFPEAHNNLANELAKLPGRLPEALAHYEAALRLQPDYVEAHYNLAYQLARIPGRLPEGLAHYETALRLRPGYAEAHLNFGNVLAKIPGRLPEALAHYEAALRISPDMAEAHNSLANELAKLPDRQPEALAHYETALRLKPDYAEAHYNLANKLARIPGREPEAVAHYEAALRLRPGMAAVHANLANELAKRPGRLPEAVAHYEAALRLEPDNAEAHNNLANKLARIPGRLPEALAHYEAALRLKPDFAEAHYNYANKLAQLPGRLPEAQAHFEETLRLNPNLAEAHCALGTVLIRLPGREAEAMAHYREALRLRPDYPQAHTYLAMALANAGQLDQAVSHLEQALKLNPAYDEARAVLGQIQAVRNRQ